MLQRAASLFTASRAERLVPTNRILPPSAATPLMKAAACAYRGWVFSRLMIWILFRSPKMNGAIFGFQKRVWCPKWTPASSICRIDTLVILNLLVGLSLRVSQSATRRTRRMWPKAYNSTNCAGHPADCDDTRAGLLKIAALYTMNV